MCAYNCALTLPLFQAPDDAAAFIDDVCLVQLTPQELREETCLPRSSSDSGVNSACLTFPLSHGTVGAAVPGYESKKKEFVIKDGETRQNQMVFHELMDLASDAGLLQCVVIVEQTPFDAFFLDAYYTYRKTRKVKLMEITSLQPLTACLRPLVVENVRMIYLVDPRLPPWKAITRRPDNLPSMFGQQSIKTRLFFPRKPDCTEGAAPHDDEHDDDNDGQDDVANPISVSWQTRNPGDEPSPSSDPSTKAEPSPSFLQLAVWQVMRDRDYTQMWSELRDDVECHPDCITNADSDIYTVCLHTMNKSLLSAPWCVRYIFHKKYPDHHARYEAFARSVTAEMETWISFLIDYEENTAMTDEDDDDHASIDDTSQQPSPLYGPSIPPVAHAD